MGFLTPPLRQWIDHPDKKSKRNIGLKGHIRPKDLTDMFWPFHSKSGEYTFFSSSHGTFSRIDHMKDKKQSSVSLRILRS